MDYLPSKEDIANDLVLYHIAAVKAMLPYLNIHGNII